MVSYYVYILASKKNGKLYVGFTDNIIRRINEHKSGKYEGFTSMHKVHKLVYYETALTSEEAQIRERRIKKWNRQWKINLIERHNPDWTDLSKDFPVMKSKSEVLDLLFGRNIFKS